MQYKLGLKLFTATAYGHAINDISYNFHHNLSRELPEKQERPILNHLSSLKTTSAQCLLLPFYEIVDNQ